MMREESVEIKAPPEKVWEMLALDRMPEWMGDWKSIAFASEVRTPEDKYQLGVSAHVTEKYAPQYDLEIIESLENEMIKYRSKDLVGGKVIMTLTYTLKPVEGGTKVTYKASFEGRWLFRAANSIMDGLIDTRECSALWNSLNNLKTFLERTRAGDKVMQLLVAGEKVILCDIVYYNGILVLTDRRLFLCGKKGFWRPRFVLKKEINLHNIVRVFGDLGKLSRWSLMHSWLIIITPQVGEEWRCEFALDSVSGWNKNRAQSMSMARVSSWVNAINLELSKSVKEQ